MERIPRLLKPSLIAATVFFSCLSQTHSSSPPPGRPLILAHYMTWFEAPPLNQTWGWHWTMNHFHPEEAINGRPSIASHYNPEIGPYDSHDPAVAEYQLLTMKLAGIDGIIISWRGLSDLYSYPSEHLAALIVVDQVIKLGMKFAVMYEDSATLGQLQKNGRLAIGDRVSHVQKEIAWILSNWATTPSYVMLQGKPVLLSFGYDGLSDGEWESVLGGLPSQIAYFSEHQPRPSATGAFDWPDPRKGGKAQEEFYSRANEFKTFIPVVYPRFHDIYAEAKVHPSWGYIPDEDGKTFAKNLKMALDSGAPIVQIATWNDWGEGTSIEPNDEIGSRDLSLLRSLRDMSHTKANRDVPALPKRLLTLRRRSHGGAQSARLDEVALLLADGQVKKAERELDMLEQPRSLP